MGRSRALVSACIFVMLVGFVSQAGSVAAAFGTVTAEALATPVVVIGQGSQPSGTVVLHEAYAGAIHSSAVENLIVMCYGPTGTLAGTQYLVVTAGDLRLRNPSNPLVPATPAAPGTPVQAYMQTGPDGAVCATWIVWSHSTVASTLEIRGSDSSGGMLGLGPTNGPLLDIPGSAAPGPTVANFYDTWDSSLWTGPGFASVVNVYRGFPTPANKDACKNDGWKTLARADGSTFKNQGDCIQYVNTGK